MSKKKNNILKDIAKLSTEELVDGLLQNSITVEQLRAAGMTDERVDEILRYLTGYDMAEWELSMNENTIDSYLRYKHKFPNGIYLQECIARMADFESSMWSELKAMPTEESIKRYLEIFTTGAHVVECEVLLEDKLWLETVKKGTLEAYEVYRAKYPERHLEEVKKKIEELGDERDWIAAIENISVDSLQYYILNHSHGKHLQDAKQLVNDFTQKEELLAELLKNPNHKSATQLQEYLKYKILSIADLERVFPKDKLDAIMSYEGTVQLPMVYPSEVLDEDRTEVYFWGTPSSGKTSVMAAIMCSALQKDCLTLWESQGGECMLRLSNLFNPGRVCVFSEGTPLNTAYEMQCSIIDYEGEPHEFTFVDFSGDVACSVYKSHAGLGVSPDDVANVVMSYALSQINKKIHFFVVEYGKQYSEWNGVRMDNHLEACANYIMKDVSFRKMTKAVYVLVTKVDLINCSQAERVQKAYEYVREYYPSFFNILELACQQAEIEEFDIVPFTVGDVFAQQLCLFDDTCANDVIQRLLINTPITKKKWWNF